MPTSRRLAYLAAHPLTPTRARLRLMRRAGIQVEGHCWVFTGLQVHGEGTLRIGAGTFINHGCYVDAAADVTIGRKVTIANGVTLVTSTHELNGPGCEQRAGERVLRPVVVEDGAWIGANVTVLPGVTVGARAMIGAGAVVTRDVKPDTLVAGVPARMVRELG